MFHLLEEVHKETKQETMIILHIVVKKKVKKIKLKNLKSQKKILKIIRTITGKRINFDIFTFKFNDL